MRVARRSRLTLPSFALGAAIAIAAATFAAQELPSLADVAVNDFANVVDPESEKEIDRWVRALINASKDYVYVVTVDTFAPYGSIEEYAVRLFERARIGTRAKDNGVLIVLAVKDRRVRIEVGYGLEEFVTDGFSGDTIRQVMLPEFREGRFGQGLLNGVRRVVQRVAEGRGVTLTDVPATPAARQPREQLPEWVVPVGIFLLFMILRSISRAQHRSRFTRRRRGGTWSGWHGGIGGFGGGGFGGGFGGFGGGGGGGGGLGGFGGGRSGGGGASGGW